MPKSRPSIKNPREYQQYFEALSNQPTSPTVEDNELAYSTADSDVSIGAGEEVTTRTTQKRKRRKHGLNKHLKDNFATYVVGSIFGFSAIALTLYLYLGLPSYGQIIQISNQIESQKELNNSVIEDIEKLEDKITSSNAEITLQLQEINMKLQEQALKFEYLEQFFNLSQ